MSEEPERKATELARRAGERARRAELASVRRAAEAMIEAFEDASWTTSAFSDVDGRVEIDVIASDAPGLRRAVRERFGPAVRLNVIAAEPRSRQTSAFNCWSVDESGRVVTVFWWGARALNAEVAVVDDGEVVLTVTASCTNGIDVAASFRNEAVATLRSPVDSRAIVDGVGNEPRPRYVGANKPDRPL